MSILFIAGLPRSANLGVADLLYKRFNSFSTPALMTGHLHLAAALSDVDLDQFSSPLNFYQSKEALLRALIRLHQMPVSFESYNSLYNFYFSDLASQSKFNRSQFLSRVYSSGFLIIDPSFSHCLYSKLINNLPFVESGCFLLVIWRHPIYFCLDLMNGVYSFDSCLQCVLASDQLSFPLDPLQVWVQFVASYLEVLKAPSDTLKMVLQVKRERFHCSNIIQQLSNGLSIELQPLSSKSSLANVTPLYHECPFSGDPSYVFPDEQESIEVSVKELSRFSNCSRVIQEVINLSASLGYLICD
ncbi:hypothetical protein N8517_00040 [Synechococcus sp. AH-601-L23]|nr:hypothetical protein [Synechococcus sp. AH-601-L23]